MCANAHINFRFNEIYILLFLKLLVNCSKLKNNIMILITLQIIFILINLFYSVYMYKKKNYKTAMFNAFAAGFCLYGLLNYLQF